MELLKERIRKEGKILPGNIVKVDGFLNHRIDVPLMEQIAQEFRRVFAGKDIPLVLTAEASGIALATICAQAFGVPMVFAKKAKSDNIEGGLYQSDILSYTYKKKVTLLVSKEWLSASDKVLIIDDFMARGEAMRGLCDIVREAGAELVGIGVAVEKGFQHGGDRLREAGIRPTAMMDISDGLSSEIMHICRRSQTGCRLYEERIPIDYQTAITAEEFNFNVYTAALNGGEDYELLFTVPLTDHERVSAIDDVKVIGHITRAELGTKLVTRDGNEFDLKAQGWNPLAAE